MTSPVNCSYAPPGEYIKDHTLLFHDGWWHLYSISGIQGYYHACNGNEETISWSISRDLVHWEMRGHVLHASQRAGVFDQHEVWAPFCVPHDGRFYLFYTGVIHPHRPMCYGKPGRDHRWIYEGHRETLGVAISTDLTDWTKVSDVARGIGIPGRDPHVVWDDREKLWLLYATGPRTSDALHHAFVARSQNLVDWQFEGVCALIPDLDDHRSGNNESLCVMRHPLDGDWIMLANWQYVKSADPHTFLAQPVCRYDSAGADLGLAGEMIEWQGRCYRSGYFGGNNNAKRLGFTEVQWEKGGAFRVVRPSILSMTPSCTGPTTAT
jgi:sucrose-6-phosphate hydrolase SacC (GH32 family)